MGVFTMPSLGADMELGTVLEWHVRPGDVVHRGDVIAVIDTEKSDIEVEVFEDGTVEELLAEVGDELPVGAPLARIRNAPAPGASPPPPAPPVPAAPAPEATARPGPPPPAERPSVATEGRPAFTRASPLARREAASRGIDLGAVAGSGPDGAVVLADLDRLAAPPAATPRGRREGRQALAALMARSTREVPHYYLATTIDLSTALAWLTDRNSRRPVRERLLPAALLLRATVLAARRVPVVNGWWEDGFRPSEAVHLGVAISRRGGGLIAPTLRDADRLSLDELMGALHDLVDRARAGTVRSSEASGATITVTNLGDHGVEEVFGVIHPPQVALVGFGKIVERPWASGGMLGVRPVVRATLSADHRASDGHDGARFLDAIDRLLQDPAAL